jgi:uncharacterized protein (DUF58 family)
MNIGALWQRSWVLVLLLLASWGAALLIGHRLFFNLTYLFGGILLCSYLWAWLNLSWVRVTRQTPSRHAQVGQTFEEYFLVENRGRLPKLWLEVRDASDLPGHQVGRVISNLGAGRQQGWRIRTPCHRRGRYRLGGVALRSSDPFGLFLLAKELPPTFTSSLVVYPLVVDLSGFAPLRGELAGGEVMRRRTHYVTTNVAGVRDYAPGDTFSRIHWPTTARTGRMMVKEFELDPMADVWLFLDMERRVQVGLTYDELTSSSPARQHQSEAPLFLKIPPSTEEYGIVIAASLVKYFLGQNRSVGLITYSNGDHREIAQTDRGERQLTRVYELLAVTWAYGTVPLAEVLATESGRLGRNTTVILVTPALDLAWIAAARHLMGRRVQVIVVIIDPGSFGRAATSTAISAELTASHIPSYFVRYGDNLAEALSSAAH